MVSHSELQLLKDQLLRVRVVDPSAAIDDKQRKRKRIRKLRPRKERREKLVDYAISQIESTDISDPRRFQRNLSTKVRDYANQQTGFVDPVTLFWILRICFLIAQFIMERRSASSTAVAVDVATCLDHLREQEMELRSKWISGLSG